jgi:hypothetical protein
VLQEAAVSILDVLRSFAGSRSVDSVLINGGISYGEAREVMARVAELESDRAALLAIVRRFIASTCGTAQTVTCLPPGVSSMISALPEALRNEVINA